MKWRLKKPMSSSSSSSSSSSISHCSQPSSLISQMFPFPWLTKFKHKNTAKPEPKPRKPNPQERHSSVLPNPPKCPSLVCENGHGKFYSFEGDGDKFWRLSFGQDSAGDKSKRVGPKPPVWYDDESKSVKETMSFDLQSLKETNKAESEAHRKSLYVSLEKQNNNNNKKKKKKKKKRSRVRASSPRAEPCKVKALEDMKRSKVKKMEKERVHLDGFAVVKSSYDPQKDFKDSMVEMISEKKMRSPEELEELLACYLTLNSDECHGLIIKVFRQVWLELGEFENQVFS